MVRIAQQSIDTLAERVDLGELIGEHTHLKRSGSGRFKGLCPFHSEKSPSFYVEPAKSTWGLYTCFGCGAGGDALTWVQEQQGVNYPDAIEWLAKRYGHNLDYEETSEKDRKERAQKARLYSANEAAQELFTDALLSSHGKIARDYLAERGFTKETIEGFGIGYAPNDWDAMAIHLRNNDVDESDAVDAGLLRTNERRAYTAFKGRLMFPIREASGSILGFAGRVLPGIDYGDKPPKYVNTAETVLYDKKSTLFGLDLAHPAIVQNNKAIVVEGYTDVMAMHAAGIHNVVATCGTAATEPHFRKLARRCQNVVFAFDGDGPGAAAAMKAWEQAAKVGLNCEVLTLPDGKDPGEVFLPDGDHAAVMGSILPMFRWAFDKVRREHDMDTSEGRSAALKAVVPLLGNVPDAAVRQSYAHDPIGRVLMFRAGFVEEEATAAGVDMPGAMKALVRVAQTGRGPVDSAEMTTAHRKRAEYALVWAPINNPYLVPEPWFELTRAHFEFDETRNAFEAIQAAGGIGMDVQFYLDHAGDDATSNFLRRIAMSTEDDQVPAEATSMDALADATVLLLRAAEKAKKQQEHDRIGNLSPDHPDVVADREAARKRIAEKYG